MRPIDADALKQELRTSGIVDTYGTQVLVKIDHAPTIDAVPVVRCKECHWCKKHPTSDKVNICTNESWNTEYYPLVTDDDFCSYGERRSND